MTRANWQSHLQTVTDWAVQIDPPVYREGYVAPPKDPAVAVRSDLDSDAYQYERQLFIKDDPKVLPFYGFENYVSVLRQGLTQVVITRFTLRKMPGCDEIEVTDVQFSHDYICPQAIRTKVPESIIQPYIARKTLNFEKPERQPKAFLPNGVFQTPPSFHPTRKILGYVQAGGHAGPGGIFSNDWDPPEYVKIAERDRQKIQVWSTVGLHRCREPAGGAGSASPTCGMIAMVDDAVGQIRQAAVDANC